MNLPGGAQAVTEGAEFSRHKPDSSVMTISWSPEAEDRYQAMIAGQMRKGFHGALLLALVLFPAFGYLDYFAHPEHLRELWSIRFGTVFIYLVLFLLIRRGRLTRFPFALGVSVGAIASASLTAMCLVLDGYQSPYYAGVNLVVLALALVMPAGARRMAPAVAVIIGIYLLGVTAQASFVIERPEMLVNNLSFLLATGIIGVTAAYLTDALRRESFAHFLELERAQADLQYSRDMLQLDLKSEQGNVELLVREVTERKAELERALDLAQSARDEAQRALRVREEFISLASHELNTPLTSLKLQTQMAQRRLLAGPGLAGCAVRRLVETYDSQLKRLIRMVADMFDITRIESGKLELERAPLDLVELVKDVVERTLEGLDEGYGELSIAAPRPVIGEWDRFRIEQVVLNLLTNARKYGRGEPIEIAVGVEDGMALLRVKDQGIGIAPESQARIFERFERAAGTRNFGGLGLGLYISQQIVTAHGGSISVESGLGQGSTFTVRLPLRVRVSGVGPGVSGVGPA